MPNGNVIEKTLNVLKLVYGFGEPFGVYFPYHGKAGYNRAHAAMAKAGDAKLPGMKDGNMAVCFVLVTAKLDRDGPNTYWIPVFGDPIKFGKKGGPDLTQLKRGLTLRARFVETQDALPWAGEEEARALPNTSFGTAQPSSKPRQRFSEPIEPPEPPVPPPEPADFDSCSDNDGPDFSPL